MLNKNKLLIIGLIEDEIESNLSFLSDVEGEEKKCWIEENKELKQLLKCEELQYA